MADEPGWVQDALADGAIEHVGWIDEHGNLWSRSLRNGVVASDRRVFAVVQPSAAPDATCETCGMAVVRCHQYQTGERAGLGLPICCDDCTCGPPPSAARPEGDGGNLTFSERDE